MAMTIKDALRHETVFLENLAALTKRITNAGYTEEELKDFAKESSDTIVMLYRNIVQLYYEYQAKVSELEKRIGADKSSIDEEITNLESAIESLNNEIAAQIANLKVRVSSLEVRMSAAEADIDALEARMETAEADIDNLEDITENHNDRIFDLEGTVDALVNETVQEIQNDVSDLKANKQDILTPGNGIDISDGIISALAQDSINYDILMDEFSADMPNGAEDRPASITNFEHIYDWIIVEVCKHDGTVTFNNTINCNFSTKTGFVCAIPGSQAITLASTFRYNFEFFNTAGPLGNAFVANLGRNNTYGYIMSQYGNDNELTSIAIAISQSWDTLYADVLYEKNGTLTLEKLSTTGMSGLRPRIRLYGVYRNKVETNTATKKLKKSTIYNAVTYFETNEEMYEFLGIEDPEKKDEEEKR